MDRNSVLNRLKTYAWPLAIAITVTLATATIAAIVVISPRVASVETPKQPVAPHSLAKVPHLLAQILLPPKSGEGAFDTPFFNAKEEPLTLRDFKGQGLVLNFWATWCGPCVREMPALDNLAAKLKASGVRVVALSEDRKAMDKVPSFYADTGIKNLDIYYDVKSQVSRKFDVQGLPTTLLIGPDGREIGRIKGALEWDDDTIVEFLVQTLAPK